MTKIERFLDDSARIRENKKNARKTGTLSLLRKNYLTDSTEALAKFYAAEFRNWHLQLGLFITMAVVVIYFCVFSALSYFQ